MVFMPPITVTNLVLNIKMCDSMEKICSQGNNVGLPNLQMLPKQEWHN